MAIGSAAGLEKADPRDLETLATGVDGHPTAPQSQTGDKERQADHKQALGLTHEPSGADKSYTLEPTGAGL